MNSDIRLSVGFLTHQKTLALAGALGDTGVVCLIRLWCWAAVFRPSGDLSGLDSDSLERAAGWSDLPGSFAATLAVLRWIEGPPNAMRLHAWSTRQGYAVNAPARSKAARIASAARWSKIRDNGRKNAKAMRSAYAHRDAPSPDPSPDPSLKTKRTSSAKPPTPAGFGEFVEAFQVAYQTGHGGAKPTWGPKQGKLVKTLLTRHPVAEVLRRLKVLAGGSGPAWVKEWDLGTFVAQFDKLAPAVAPNGPRRCYCGKPALGHTLLCLEHAYTTKVGETE